MIENNEQSPQPEVTHEMPGVDNKPNETIQIQKERAAFARYVKEQGEKIPDNFKSSDDWFNSLVEARSQFTKSRQEIADLKKQYNQNATTNPTYKEPVANDTAVVTESKTPDFSSIPDELKIQDTKDVSKLSSKISQDDWVRWSGEIERLGTVSDTTRKEIKERIGAEDAVVEQLVKGHQALRKESFNNAASVVGGSDKLKELFAWAQANIPKDEIQSINKALQTPVYNSILLGLKARMDASAPKPSVNKEPKVALPRANNPNVPNQVQVFASEYAQKAAISDPRYRVDPSYRQAVEAMIVNSSRFGFKST